MTTRAARWRFRYGTATPNGLWALEADGLVPLAESERPIVLVPSEAVLMLAVALPLPTHRRRREALPFAVEDRLAAPLAETHVALGAAIAPRRYLAAAVARDTMAAWIAVLTDAGLADAALVPDALTLPIPEEAGWSVRLADGRALVRAGDGTGFALAAANLQAAWTAAGKPACTAFGEALPPDMGGRAGALPPWEARLARLPLDLRQGDYARRGGGLSPLGRVAVVAAAALAAQGAIAAVDRVAGGHAPAGQPAPGRFLPLLTEAATALAPTGARIEAIDFDGARGLLDLTITPENAGAAKTALEGLGRDRVAARRAGADGRLIVTLREPGR